MWSEDLRPIAVRGRHISDGMDVFGDMFSVAFEVHGRSRPR